MDECAYALGILGSAKQHCENQLATSGCMGFNGVIVSGSIFGVSGTCIEYQMLTRKLPNGNPYTNRTNINPDEVGFYVRCCVAGCEIASMQLHGFREVEGLHGQTKGLARNIRIPILPLDSTFGAWMSGLFLQLNNEQALGIAGSLFDGRIWQHPTN